MLRVHFTGEDLLRIRVLTEPRPTWELLVSKQIHRAPDAHPDFARWRARVRSALPGDFRAAAVEPHWPVITRLVRQDATARVAAALREGFEAVLTALHPAVRWAAPVLEIDHPADAAVRLAGRGLTLAPAFFWCGAPVTLLDGGARPTLVYAVPRGRDWDAETDDASSRADSLDALLGRTRAKVLWAIAERPHLNTTELARAVGISAAGASQHTTVLRAAGLVTTCRDHGSARHRISERGAVLLDRVPTVHRVFTITPPPAA